MLDNIQTLIEEIKSYAKEHYVPIVRNNTIEKIVAIIKEKQYKNILEIGTAIGYSGILMLNCKETKLTTIEKDEVRAKEAINNFEKAGLLNRTTLLIGDAYEILLKLNQSNQKYDFIFLDGPKGQYIRYFPFLKNLLENGGTLFADNILLGGLLTDEKRVTHKNRAMVNNMKSFVNAVQEDKDFQTEIYKIDDGFTISELKKV